MADDRMDSMATDTTGDAGKIRITLPNGSHRDYTPDELKADMIQALYESNDTMKLIDRELLDTEAADYWMGEALRLDLRRYLHYAYEAGFDTGAQFGKLAANEPAETVLERYKEVVKDYWTQHLIDGE